MSGFGFALRPRWLLSHVLVLVLVVVMVNLGLWQLQRLDERRDRNDVIAERMAEPAAAASVVLGAEAGPDEVDGATWRAVEVTGTYQAGRSVLVANRAQNGQPGYWVVTPLDSDEVGTVAVVRGFVNRSVVATGGLVEIPATTREVRVTGRVVESLEGRLSPDTLEGYPQVSAPDTEVLGEHWGVSLGAWWLQAEQQEPPRRGAEVLAPLAPPDLGDGPHLGYAVQWFVFATIAAVGYPLILRSNAHRRGGHRPAGDPGPAPRPATET